MEPSSTKSALTAVTSILTHAACGGVLGMLAAARIGAGFLAQFGLFFGACVGLLLSPLAILLFRASMRSWAIGIACACAITGIVLAPWPAQIDAVFLNAVFAWIGSIVLLRVVLVPVGRAWPARPLPDGIRAVCAAGVIALSMGAFGVAKAVRSWPRATDPASALQLVEHAYRSNEMTVHELGHTALRMISEADAERLSRDLDYRVRRLVARGLTGAQSEEFARITLHRLAGDGDRYVRSEALWSMIRRWPQEMDSVVARMRADAHPGIRDDADNAVRLFGR